MSKSTLVAVLRHLSLEPEFIETVTSLGDDSKVSFSLEDLDSQSLSLLPLPRLHRAASDMPSIVFQQVTLCGQNERCHQT